MITTRFTCTQRTLKSLLKLPKRPEIARASNATTEKRYYHVMKAVVVHGKGVRVAHHRATPALRDDCVLVRPVAVALNPTDWKHVRYERAKDDCIVGCDYAGVVEAVGSAVTKKWQPGDRIFGCSHGANLVNPDDGVFAEKAAVLGDLQMRIPESISFEQAATMGLGAITVGQGLFQKALKLDLPSTTPNPTKKGAYVLVYGGTTSTGALGIQFAKQAGYTVITACSADGLDYMKSLGVDMAIDYKTAGAAEKIRDYTGNELAHAWDTISNEQSAKFCADALSTSPSTELRYGTLNPVESPRKDVRTTQTIMYTAFGRPFKFGPRDMPAMPEDYEFGKAFFGLTEELLFKGLIKPHIHEVKEGGLQGVMQGLQDLEAGRQSHGKLVYRIRDTL